MRICSDCVKNSYIKEFINENGDNGCCYLCKKNKTSIVLDDENEKYVRKKINNMVKALMRYNYSDIFFADEPVEFLFQENEIIKVNDEIINQDDYDVFISKLVGSYYGDDTGVDLIYDKKCPYLKHINVDEVIEKWEKELEEKNYFLIIDDIKKTLKPVLPKLEINKKIEECYRGRIGIKFKVYKTEENYDKILMPWKGIEIGPPPVKLAKEGRFNKDRVSYLYVASSIQTSIAELKPSIGSYISMGKFKSKKELKILDFTSLDIHNFWNSEKDIKKFILLNSLKKRFSLPRVSKDYYFTQIISDVIRELGYDAIIYDSSVHSGYNYLIFDVHNMEYIDGFSKVYKIKEINYISDELESNVGMINEDDDYNLNHKVISGLELLKL